MGVLVAIACGTIAGLALLWPGDVEEKIGPGLAAPTELAEVERVVAEPCPGLEGQTCRELRILVLSGPDEGERAAIDLGPSATAQPEIRPGDRLRVSRSEAPPPEAGPRGGAPEGAAPGGPVYSLTDFERRAPMLWLALIFAAAVVVLGRLRGAFSLAGLSISLAVVLAFVVPAILDGSPPLAVAVVGSLAIMLITISLAHGLGPKSLAAMLGTALALVLTIALAVVFTELTHLTGFSSEEATLLSASVTGISLEGLLLAGMVIAALGVLDDVTVSQASTVMALRAANPAQSFGELYRSALQVGRDHVSATVNTLVLAYVGASLPILLVFSSGEVGFLDAVSGELVAKEVVAMLVGSTGIVAAVPITTALAALLSAALPTPALARAAGTGHSH